MAVKAMMRAGGAGPWPDDEAKEEDNELEAIFKG